MPTTVTIGIPTQRGTESGECPAQRKFREPKEGNRSDAIGLIFHSRGEALLAERATCLFNSLTSAGIL
jgi:hypothetical protein